MFDQNITPLALSSLLPVAKGATNAYRPYYSEVHGLSMQPVFDSLADSKVSTTINPLAFGISASTLHSKLNDALAWLIDNHPEKEKYITVRDCYKFGRRVNAIVVTYKAQDGKFGQPIFMAPAVTETSWFLVFTAWLTTATENDIFDSESRFGGVIKISPEQEMSVIKLCASVGAELEMDRDNGKFKVAK